MRGDIEWLLNRAEAGEPPDGNELEVELKDFTLPELRGLLYLCRTFNPILWVTREEEAENADHRWMTLEAVCRVELSQRGVPFLSYEPEVQEQLEAYAAYLNRMGAMRENAPDAELDARLHRVVLTTGLVIIFTRDADERGAYSHLSLSAIDRVPSWQEVGAVVEAFFEGWRGVQEVPGSSGERIRHFMKRADSTRGSA